MEGGAADGARHVEEKVAVMPERVLDIVAEHPQKQHVAAEVEDVGMQEGIGQVAEVLRDDDELGRQFGRVVDHGGDEAEAEHGRVAEILAADGGRQIGGHVEHDQDDRDVLQPDGAQMIGVVERDEHRALPRPPAE